MGLFGSRKPKGADCPAAAPPRIEPLPAALPRPPLAPHALPPAHSPLARPGPAWPNPPGPAPAVYPYTQPIVVNQHYYLAPPLPPADETVAETAADALARLGLGGVASLLPACVQDAPADASGLFAWPGPSRPWRPAAQLAAVPAAPLRPAAALRDRIADTLDDVLTLIDGARDDDAAAAAAAAWQAPPSPPPSYQDSLAGGCTPPDGIGGFWGAVATQEQAALPQAPDSAPALKAKKTKAATSARKASPKGQTTAVAASVVGGSYFSKVFLYANSRLPLDLPPLKLYMPTYPLLCLAAQYSERVYDKPRGAERDDHVAADWRSGTKAMVVKSVPMDDANIIVLAVRGTSSFMDWAVNLKMDPTSPAGFLDDAGNLCHAGFLAVARAMVKPVAARLRALLREKPARAKTHSLLFTGHSAGGAVAALLYAHMGSATAGGELRALASSFRRVHCVSFGAPPVSLLPIDATARAADKDDAKNPFARSVFLAFVNEGDPVARADPAYVRSLVELLASPAPTVEGQPARAKNQTVKAKDDGRGRARAYGPAKSQQKRADSAAARPGASASPHSKSGKDDRPRSKSAVRHRQDKHAAVPAAAAARPVWPVPHCTLCVAGRVAVLRSAAACAKPKDKDGRKTKTKRPSPPSASGSRKPTVEDRLAEGAVAHAVSDQQLRGVVWGDPLAHVMRLYAGRIEMLAVGAVTVGAK